jgi:hypothetical protein
MVCVVIQNPPEIIAALAAFPKCRAPAAIPNKPRRSSPVSLYARGFPPVNVNGLPWLTAAARRFESNTGLMPSFRRDWLTIP